MPIADTKKAATIRNLWHLRVAQPILDTETVVAAIRAAIVDNSIQSQFTAGELTAMQAVESDLQAMAALAGVTQAAAAVVPTHRNRAVIIAGVND